MQAVNEAFSEQKWSRLVEVGVLTIPGIILVSCQMAEPKVETPPPAIASTPAVELVAGADTPLYALTLKPEVDENGVVEAIEVSSQLTGGLAEGEERLKLFAPVVYVNVMGIADRVTELDVRDASGSIDFTIEEDDPVPGGYPYFRHWTAKRDVTFPVSINYRALVQPEGGPGGPAFGIRPSAGGISGAGAGFMLVPSNAASQESILEWDLSGFDQPSLGVTTFGDGRAVVEGPPPAIMQGWYMAGPVEHYPDDVTEGDFHAYWLGDFPFDEREGMSFTAKMYDYFEGYFEHLDPAPEYRVFMRLLQTPPYGGGTALANSFMLSRGPVQPEEEKNEDYGDIRMVFVHELLHQWVGSVEGGSIDENWWSEGLTTYYQYTLPFKAGEIAFEEYVEGINRLSRNLYTNPGRDWSIAEIKKVGFDDNDIRHVPYQRGALYFADLDARIRAASGGERDLHSFLSDVFVARETGDIALTPDKWRELVREQTGEDETAFHKALHVDGMVFFPAAGSFGPCVVGERVTLERDGESFDAMQWLPASDADPKTCRFVTNED
ncbi:M61 family metallopeptidase [Henriciella mobilis]|uniref:M61 family metallopeptidase n=1 Tax=Henriciella mobilis TaxID=2305467 RepID=UPI001314B334|nr:hypothetical protein [Henriciella mobilis]